MTKIKVGDRVKRVRNSLITVPDCNLTVKINETFTVAETRNAHRGDFFFSKEHQAWINAADCELVEQPTCPHCGQPLPEPETVTVPEHKIPLWLTEEPKHGAEVWLVGACGPVLRGYSRLLLSEAFNAGLLYAKKADAQARYEAIIAPTRRD